MRQELVKRQKKQGTLFEPSPTSSPLGSAAVYLPPGEAGHKVPRYKNNGENRGEAQGPTLQSLLKLYDEAWIDEWYEDKKAQEEYKAKGKQMLTAFYNDLKGRWPDMLYLEQPFRISLGGYAIKGAIDRIDKITSLQPSPSKGEGVSGAVPLLSKERLGEVPYSLGGVAIIDYKTGGVPEEAAVEKDQLILYQIAVKESLGLEAVSLEYYYLKENQRVTFLGTEREIEKLKEKIISTIKEMQASDFKAAPSQHKCRYCDFKEICEFRMLG